MKIKTIIGALFAGVAIALLTGLVTSTPPNLVGAAWYGLPLAWLFKMVVAPQYNPWAFDFVNLALDIIFWAAILWALAFVFGRIRRRPSAQR